MGRLRESINNEIDKRYLLFAPILLLVFGGFVLPFLILIRVALAEQPADSPYQEGSWTFDSFIYLLTSDLIQYVITFSVFFAVVTTLIALVISVFYSYAMWRADGLTESILIFSAVLPLLTTLSVKTYAWLPILSPSGSINNILLFSQLISEPFGFAPGIVGAVVSQVYNMLPFGILAVYSVLISVDESKVEAARDLGATRVRSFYEVVLPEMIPGIAVASVIFVTWSVGSYAAPQLLGGGSERPFAVQIESYITAELQWAFAGALSVVMILVGSIGVIIVLWLLNKSEGGVQIVE